jgi:secreted trypsin-like serine protease
VGGERCWREYQLSLGYAQGSTHVHFCGAVLVEPRVAYTAAHCKPQVGDQVSGGHREYALGDKVRVSDVLVHDEYGWPVQHNNDVAVLLLERQPVGSEPIEVARTDPRPEVSLVEASGWGHTREGGAVSQTLLCVDLPLLSDLECQEAHSTWTNAMGCAGWQQGGMDACQGDSGGPYVVTINGVRLLLGLTSFGDGCARPDAPGFLAWLPGPLGDEAAACASEMLR